MTSTSPSETAAPARAAPSKFYRAAWRWHFYAGLFVIPFMIILSLTGLAMMLNTGVANQLGAYRVTESGAPLPVSAQARAAQESRPEGVLDQYVAPEAADRPAFFILKQDGRNHAVAVDPYTAEVLGSQDKAWTIYGIANDIHGELLIGQTGDLIMEAAASLTILLVVTGLYLWWPRDRGALGAFIPRLGATRRAFWKELHMTGGVWVSLFLLLFCLSGLAWAGIWGAQFVQPWSSFPIEKKAAHWSSDVTHASMNHGPLDEVPWGLEQTPMPVSGFDEGAPGLAQPATLDTAAQWAAAHGMTGQVKINLPRGETGVFTISQASRNEDGVTPSQDRTVHFDRYTGKLLADIRYDDYSVVAKLMAQGIALHKGLAGAWNFVLNLVLIGLILLTCVSGVVMWLKRRPEGAGRMFAPPMPAEMPFWKGAALAGLAVALAFPMAGLSLLAVLTLDMLVVSRVPALRRALS